MGINSSKTIFKSSVLDSNSSVYLLKRGNITLTLNNGKVGETKIIQIVDDSVDGIIEIIYNNGWSGISDTVNMYSLGDCLVMVATVKGWHVFSKIN